MQGTVLTVRVANGDTVEPGDVLCIVEAMKMENEVRAHRGGVVAELSVEAGQPVKSGQAICVISTEELQSLIFTLGTGLSPLEADALRCASFRP